MRAAVIAVLIAASVVVAGCASSAQLREASSKKPQVLPLRADLRIAKNVPCLDWNTSAFAGPAAVKRFRPVTAVSCVDGTRIYPGQGEWDVRIRRVAVGGVTGLQKYFEQPSVTKYPKNLICTANLVSILIPVFVDARGRTLVPETPVDACHHPLAYVDYGKGSTAVRWHVVSVRKLRLQISAPALAANCAMGIKDLPAGGIGPLDPSSGGALFKTAPKTVRVCIYRTPANDFEVGNFVRGFRLDAAKTRRLLGAMTGAAPTGRCTNQRTFAWIGGRNDVWAEVELGGCWRVGRTYPYYGMGGADLAVVSALLRR